MRRRDAGESQRQPATAYAAFSSSFQAEPAHTRQTPKSSATWRKRGPQTRLETHDEVPPRRWAVASTLRLCGRLTVSASWPCRIAPARQRLQAHQSLTMHLGLQLCNLRLMTTMDGPSQRPNSSSSISCLDTNARREVETYRHRRSRSLRPQLGRRRPHGRLAVID